MWKFVFAGLLFGGLLFSSCKNKDFYLGGNLVDAHVKIVMIDTLTVKLSNLAIDSVVTSNNYRNKNIAFAGYYNDPEIGKLWAQSYIEFSRSTNSESNKNAYFDSIMLVLLPNGNYYGDTLKRASLQISKLTKEIEMGDDGYMYSTSSMPTGDILTEATFKMKPKSKEEIEVRLPNDFGEMLFKGMLDNELYLHYDNYLETFPGLSISAGAESSCVYGFGVTDTSCLIRIYYSISTTTKEQKAMEFKPNTAKLFYRFVSEKLPDLQDINLKDDPKPSSKTRNMGILMSGTPMYTRIEFPYLNDLLHMAEIVIIKEATLFIRPVFKTYDTVPLPPKLNLFYHDPADYYRKGSPLSERVSSGGSQTLTGNLPANWHQQLTPYYSFNITDYISSQLGLWGYNIRNLNIAIPDDEEASTVQRLLFGDQQYKYPGNIPDSENRVQLRIVYITFND